MVHEGANRSDSGDIVVAEECGEIDAALDEFVGGLEAEFRRGDAELQLNNKLWGYDQLEIAGDGHEAIPAIVGVGAVAAASHEGDFTVTELVEMTERKFGSALLVEYDVGDAFDFAMASDDDGGENAEAFFERGVDKDKAFDRAIHEEARVLFDEVGFAAVTRSEVEVALFNEMLFNAAEHLHGIAVTEFGDENADREGLSLAQRAREKTGAVVEFSGRFCNAITGFLRNGSDSGRVVQNQGNGSR